MEDVAKPFAEDVELGHRYGDYVIFARDLVVHGNARIIIRKVAAQEHDGSVYAQGEVLAADLRGVVACEAITRCRQLTG